MTIFSFAAPSRLHEGVIVNQIKAVFPDIVGIIVSGGMLRTLFPDGTGASLAAVGVIVAAHDPPATTVEEQISRESEKAEAKAAFETALAGLTKAKVDLLAEGITNVATARESIRKIGYAVLYLLKREGIA